MKCTIQIEDDNNVICKNVCDSDGSCNAPFYERGDMIETFLTALQGMGFSLGRHNAEGLAEEVESMIIARCSKDT